jgi:CBS-domain-containing membrane protein
MTVLPGRLGMLTAHDVMTRSIITLQTDERVEDAVVKLRENHITGAPVVDGSGKLVGILSISDLVDQSDATGGHKFHGQVEGRGTWQLFSTIDSLAKGSGGQTVGERMSSRVTSVEESTLLLDLARTMCDGHWHRVPVISAEGEVCGIVSTMDILAAIVNVADEPN